MQQSIFVPNSQKACTALVQYIVKNGAAVAVAKQQAGYLTAVAGVRALLAAHFAKFPPQAIIKSKKDCAWTITGATEMCKNIAAEWNVPYWNVVGSARPGSETEITIA
jgi:hypothetical protein